MSLEIFFWRYCMMQDSRIRKDETYKGIQEITKRRKSLEMLQDFAKFSIYYAQIAGLTRKGLEKPLREGFKRLNQWKVTVSYTFLMRAMDAIAKGDVKQDDLVKVIRLIESYIIRRAICNIPTNRLSRIFAEMSKRDDFFTNDLYQNTQNHLLCNRWPNDEDFVPAFVQFPLYDSPQRANWVLWTLERAFGGKEPPKNTRRITIEHIMPQTLKEAWEKELGDNWSEVHDKWLHTVGNLTLTGYNPSLANKPFSEKKTALTESNFALSKSIQDFEVWNEDSIRRRGEQLAELALQVWKR